MHAKHDYNPVKTAYPIDSVPEFDESEYPEVMAGGKPSDGKTTSLPHIIIETEESIQTEEDLALLEKTQQSAFHQSKNFQGSQAYKGQGYEPTSTELESTISWGVLIGCAVLLVIFLIAGGIFGLVALY
ncbi:MAG: hypothetical protein FWE26_05430 [Coriobacteriia bacterium]|nr:hypothetical protein [Coriobacteriia bacterium]MCL2871047.1 hypothetical protein [Coriobacteriia bacterium]